MGRKVLPPPQYVYAPVELVYGDLPRAIAMTGLRIWGLGFAHHYERTDAILQERLLEICRVGRSQLYEHLGYLVATGMLRYTNINSEFTFIFNRPARWKPSPENRTGSALSVVVDFSPCTNMPKKQQQQEGSVRGEAENPGEPDWWAGEQAAKGVLEEMGILEPTCSELARLTWATEEYLAAWADWLANQEGVGVGVVIVQVRAGVVAPELPREQRERLEVKRWVGEVVKR